MFDSDPFGRASRARNQESLGDFGDPERWGGYCEFTVEIPTNDGPPGLYVLGPQIVRVQFTDLRARAVDILTTFEISGQDLADGSWMQIPQGFTGFGIEMSVGVGQVTASLRASPVFGVPVNPWSSTADRFGANPATGVLQLLFPFPGVNINIRPIFGILSSAALPHTLTVRATILASPRY